MKTKTIFLSLILCCFSLFSLFGLVGCGEANIGTLKENFGKLDTLYQEYTADGIFEGGLLETGLPRSDYVVTYGTVVQKKVDASEASYKELRELYNLTLAISHDYIDNNKSLILIKSDEDLNSESKTALNNLNGSLVEYIASLERFVDARSDLIEYFDNVSGSINAEADENHLRLFKKSYGDLVSKNLTLSTNLAKIIETTEIFELLSETNPQPNDTKLIKEYVRAKLLPIFAELRITEIENKFNFNNSQNNGDDKARIQTLLDKLDAAFEIYKPNFVSDKTTVKLADKDATKNLFDLIKDFFTEADSYFKALQNFNFSKFAEYKHTMEDYLKENSMAEIYLTKMEKFVEVTLPEFMNAVVGIIY
ncbi:MAG: hypothetical protein J6K39_03735 [Clostridia bacterium]|nr:hypothetical protein [Clostridia bacterium]